jgi:hypothetical protein
MPSSVDAPRRRRWPIFLPTALVVGLAVLWSGGWFYLAGEARTMIDRWRAREARAGLVFACADQTIGGFPFRMEVHCGGPSAEFPAMAPPAALNAASALLMWQVYQPSLLIAEFGAPLALGEAGKPPAFRASWRLAEASLNAAPTGIERVSLVVETPALDRIADASSSGVLKATHVELHGRQNAASTADHPAADLALQLLALSAPALHPLLAQPIDADGEGVLHEFPDPAPKPWPELLREWQARGGRLEISRLRIAQGEVLAVGAGTLALTERGGLEGQLQVTVVGLEKFLQALGIDRMASQGDIGSALGALNRFVPGLGDLARQNAGAGIVAGLGALGQRTTLEGKPAVTVPLRFDDGAVLLGPLMLGRVAPAF